MIDTLTATLIFGCLSITIFIAVFLLNFIRELNRLTK